MFQHIINIDCYSIIVKLSYIVYLSNTKSLLFRHLYPPNVPLVTVCGGYFSKLSCGFLEVLIVGPTIKKKQISISNVKILMSHNFPQRIQSWTKYLAQRWISCKMTLFYQKSAPSFPSQWNFFCFSQTNYP